MARRNFEKKLGLCLATFLSMNLLSVSVQATESVKDGLLKETEGSDISITPLPKSMEVDDDSFDISESVNIVGEDKADKDAVELLKSILHSLDIEVNSEFEEGDTTIYIGEKDDNIEELNEALEDMEVSTEDLTKAEGYVLATEEDDDGNVIVIRGNDESGTFYGVQSFKQILSKDDDDDDEVSVNEVVVKDEPSISLRAVVEGFYGEPWTQEERLDQLNMYGEFKMNAYIYAPKSDPYHREKWREPYPASELDRMKELINTANKNKVDFVFAISPGLDIRFEGEEGEADFKALLNKAETLYDMGVRRFSILWDDIENHDGAQQAQVLNRFNEEFVKAKGDVKSLITVPVQYWGSSMFDGDNVKEYTKAFAETLDKDIEVMWTGNDVIPPNGVSIGDAQKVTGAYGKKMMLWWNYPVNDYKENKMALGPIYDLDVNLDDEISGFIVNPMRFAESSKISTITGADYAWNTKNYDAESSWDSALEVIAGEAKDDLKYFANHSTRLDTGRPDSPEFKALIDKLWEKWNKGEDVSLELNSLKAEFDKMTKTPSVLRESLENKKLLSQIDSHLTKFEEYGRSGLLTVSMLDNIKKGDMVNFWNDKFAGIKTVRNLDSMDAIIANNVIDPFIRKAHEVGTDYFNEKTTVLKDKVYKYTSIGNIADHKYSEWFISEETHVPNYMFDDKLNTGFWSADLVKKDEYVGFDLGAVENIKDVYLLMGRTAMDTDVIADGVLEYSVDGTNWTELKVNEGNNELLVETNVKARYIRYRATKDSENRLYVRDFKVNTNKTLEKTVGDVDLSKATIQKSADSEKEVVSLSNIGKVELKEGQAIGLSLNDVKNVISIEALGNNNAKAHGGEFVIESSYDNLQWKKVSEGLEFSTEKPVVGKYFRIKALKDTTLDLNSINIGIETYTSSEISTNRRVSTNANIHPDFIKDNDYGTSFVCSDTIKEGDFVQIDLGKVKHVRDINLVQGPGGDYIEGDIQYSVDGENWTNVGEVEGIDTLIKDLDLEARYVRVLSKGYKDRWSRVREFTVNTTIAEYKTEASVPGTYVDRTENTRDENLNTAYIPSRDIVSGDYFLYRIFDNKLTSKITIPQSSDNLSGAKVTAQTIDGEILELGVLDKAFNEFLLENPRHIVSVKLLWENNAGKPEIFEIKPTFVGIDSIMEKIKGAIITAEKVLAANPDKKNKERTALEESLCKIKDMINSDEFAEDEKIKAYEDLIKKTDLFIASSNSGSEGDTNKPGGDNNKPGEEENPDEDKKPGEDNSNGNLPNTGNPMGAGVLALIGGATLAVGFKVRKRK
ncbi:beta-N-acetylglucosaminidase domain-containing protein [Clostridium tarantellae]|uniref:Hyaluronidase n=1 Tax=Clostridium tarantellae TaxID=39493 RepID=A0A6I1MM31_9CLOT|nr:beta-N-acetylglucosaminidase domain-containing protein [Clostridium tarantellae]MPQ43498.1 hyaluronidase [Clostridium tarantellae]